MKQGCDLILAAGGDGTINEAVNGMAGSDVAFGALPAGTANVLFPPESRWARSTGPGTRGAILF